MRNHRLDISPTSGALGAFVHGVDLSGPLEDSDIGEMREALNEHGVIFFRDQKISPEQHIAFAERFGPIDINRFFQAAPGHPQIAEVRKEPGQTTNIGGGWHTDHSYDQEPALGSILLARETPPRGGDTLFACMNRAYEWLSFEFARNPRAAQDGHGLGRGVFQVLALAAPYLAPRERELLDQLATRYAN